MNCLVIASTGKEIKPLLDWLKLPENNRLELDILITGVGLMAATYSLTRQISIKRPDFVLQAGVAGSFKKKLSPGTVIAVQKDCIADLGVREKKGFKSIFDLGLQSPDIFPFTKKWLVNGNDILGQTTLKKATAISINEITTGSKRIALLEKSFSPDIESMEGAALHYVCLKENIPFLQLRAVSNYIGERNKKNWKLKESIINLNNELIRLLETL